MLKNIKGFFKKIGKKEIEDESTKDAAKERLHLVLMQDRANVSADFLELMKQEIIDVIKKYVDVDEAEIDVRLTNQVNDDGTNGAPALYANIPITGIKNDNKLVSNKNVNVIKNVEVKENVIEKNGNDKIEKEVKKVVPKSDVNKEKQVARNDLKNENEKSEEIKVDKKIENEMPKKSVAKKETTKKVTKKTVNKTDTEKTDKPKTKSTKTTKSTTKTTVAEKKAKDTVAEKSKKVVTKTTSKK